MSKELAPGDRVRFSTKGVFKDGQEFARQPGVLICGTVQAIEYNLAGVIVELDDKWAHMSPDGPVRVALENIKDSLEEA